MNHTFDFVPITSAHTSISELLANTRNPVVALGAPSVANQLDVLEPDLKQFQQSSTASLGIVPVGRAGELLWSRLPIAVAGLAAEPRQCGLFIAQRDWLSQQQDQSFWHFIVKHPASTTIICDAIAIQHFTPQLPNLAAGNVTTPQWLRDTIDCLQLDDFAAEADFVALKAGLYQLHDDLDESHSLSQRVQGAGRNSAADYWHAIMHRREPDYGNSKYWFRRVGRHPVFPSLSMVAHQTLSHCDSPQAEHWREKLCCGDWDPLAFVDLCQSCAQDEVTPLALAAREIQWFEMLLLLEQTYRDATGAPSGPH